MSREDEIRARCDKATPGPWVCSDRGDGSGSVYPDGPNTHLADALIDDNHCPFIRGEVRYEDGVFAAHAREDIPYLLQRISELEKK